MDNIEDCRKDLQQEIKNVLITWRNKYKSEKVFVLDRQQEIIYEQGLNKIRKGRRE